MLISNHAECQSMWVEIYNGHIRTIPFGGTIPLGEYGWYVLCLSHAWSDIPRRRSCMALGLSINLICHYNS